MTRRQILKLLASGLIGHTLDVDKLLWIPEQKTIFLPSEISWIHKPSTSEILALELKRIMPKLKELFERDDMFYKLINK